MGKNLVWAWFLIFWTNRHPCKYISIKWDLGNFKFQLFFFFLNEAIHGMIKILKFKAELVSKMNIPFLRGNCTPNQKIACFVPYLKIIHTGKTKLHVPDTKRVTLVYLYHVNRCGSHKKLLIAKLDFVQVCGLSLNFYSNTLRKFYKFSDSRPTWASPTLQWRIDQSADNITGLKCAKECLILKYIITSRILADTGTSQYWWILEHFWFTNFTWKCDIYIL